MMITLQNDFHNTEARVRGPIVSARAVDRAWRNLCGMDECRCGGMRGPAYDSAGRKMGHQIADSRGALEFFYEED